MSGRVRQKWRPGLGLIVFAVLTTVMALPLVAFIFFRIYETSTTRQMPPGIDSGSVLVPIFALTVLAVLTATLAIGFVFWRTITKPIYALVARAGEVGHGRSEFVPLDHHGTREIALLSQSFADMTARVKERSDYIATFAAHVSHELKTPLTSIKGAAELLRDDPDAMPADKRQLFLDNIISDTGRLAAMLERLRDLARAESTEPDGTARLDRVVEQVQAAFPQLAIETQGAADVPVAISPENFAIVLSHLADNAASHSAMALNIRSTANDRVIEYIVGDDGDGISELNRDRIFDNFFTTRRESGGTGMGLGIVRALVQAHGGTIVLEPSESGARFKLTLPRA